MRELSEVELSRLKLLTENSIEVTLLEPTSTGLQKSILDATTPVRAFLKKREVHEYGSQLQGEDYKVLIQAKFVEEKGLTTSRASLYRPPTKNGDPRIWFKGLPGYAKPNDILAIIEFERVLYVVNLSRLDIAFLLSSGSSSLLDLVKEIKLGSSQIAGELLMKLRDIASRGPTRAVLNADTAVGRTLESLLGIPINSSKKPDYKGIELKSFRDKRGNRKTLFAQVANWKMSKLKSSAQILDTFGYERDDEFKLNCTVSTKKPNTQSLQLRLQGDEFLFETSTREGLADFATWELKKLHERLLEKHSETFWIAANVVMEDGIEHYHYTEVEHTKSPIVTQLDILLDQGIVTMDHLIERDSNGKVVEKGPLFKIHPKCVGLLFPPSNIYKLV